ncbi:MAG: hypothetical protein ISN29_05250 [Gammaproteobacteria bacterium AqS3]|nr:hypothetical protein [Gammaproteobacteria bacterium AqS3]
MMKSPSDEFTLNMWADRRFDIEAAIYDGYYEDRDESPHRDHLGASDIGNECPRHIWYTYRHAHRREFNPRLYKVFATGHRAEPIFANDLRRAGIEIEIENKDGKQFSFTDYGGHVTVNLDGIGRVPDSLPAEHATSWKRVIFEMKTMSLKRFKTMTSKGLKAACPEYYRQVQMQLHVAERQGEQFDGALFVAVCKDNDENFVLEVKHDREMQARLRKEVISLLKGNVPDRLNVSEKVPPCRFCGYLKVCKQDRYDLIEKNCRTCNHASMVLKADNNPSGTWKCDLGHEFGTPCSDWGQYIGF